MRRAVARPSAIARGGHPRCEAFSRDASCTGRVCGGNPAPWSSRSGHASGATEIERKSCLTAEKSGRSGKQIGPLSNNSLKERTHK